MLKDKFAKFFDNSKKEKEPLKVNIMDGFVDIKGYKVSKDGTKKLVYHDCGDNVVTDWMRHAIMNLLTGSVFSSKGDNSFLTDTGTSKKRDSQITFMDKGNHTPTTNLDGYLLSGSQFFWDGSKDFPLKYSKSTLENNFALFPTKVLFGTGKEYSSWDVLKSENEVANASWYTDMLSQYGGDPITAKANFDTNISLECNKFSGSIANNINSGDGVIVPMRTVNDPDTSSKVITSNSSMNKNYGVVGAVKTIYFDEKVDAGLLQKTITDGGKLLSAANRGVGRPCFLYLNVPSKVVQGKDVPLEGWDESSSDVFLDKDESSPYLNRITFKVKMPAQSASEDQVGSYYPYNGYTLKQMGLYNDAKLVTRINGGSEEGATKYAHMNMPCGTLLAIKNITALDKTADVELVMTWTLTI